MRPNLKLLWPGKWLASTRRFLNNEITFFHCSNGRLKLREIEGQQAQLIQYISQRRAQLAKERLHHFSGS